MTARHLGISLNRITFDPNGQQILEGLESYISFHEEPVSNLAVTAQIEMLKVARAKGVTVLLSGQGGDELFCGYNKYFYFAIQQLLREGRPIDAATLGWTFFRNGTVLRQFSVADAARYAHMRLPGVAKLPLGESLIDIHRTDIGVGAGNVRDRQLADLLRFSAPAITHAEDRTSMALSREVRFPFLDWRLMEFALSLPLSEKIGAGWTKRVLRLAMAPLLPPEIAWRKDKIGHFSATREWLVRRGDVIRHRLDRKSPIFTMGFLDADRLFAQWDAFWSGQRNATLSVRQVISLLTLDMWLRKFV